MPHHPDSACESKADNDRQILDQTHRPIIEAEDFTNRRDSLLDLHDLSTRSTAVRKHGPSAIRPLSRTCTCLNCAPHLYLETIHAHELRDFRRPTSTLAFFQHDSLQLAHLATSSFRPSFIDRRTVGRPKTAILPPFLAFAQHHALQKGKHWLGDVAARRWSRDPHLSKYDPNNVFQVPVAVFSELFFLGQIPTIASGSLLMQWSPPGTRRRAHSHTDDQRQTTIWINAQHPQHFLSLKEVLNTLLHELCHAFLQRYSCYMGGGFGCDRNQTCVELCQENYGATGHGRAWQMLAAAIEEAAPKLLGESCSVDLGRDECAVQEMHQIGDRWWPSECDLKIVGDDLGWKIKALLRSREEDAIASGRVRSWLLRDRRCPRTRGRRNSM